MLNKSFKTTEITLALDWSEDEMFIGYNSLLKYDQSVDEQVEQPTDEQDEGMKDAEIDDNNSNNMRKKMKERKRQ